MENITKEDILVRIESLREKGMNVKSIISNHFECSNNIEDFVRLSDPLVNVRVTVELAICNFDTIEDIHKKLDICDEKMRLASEINKFKEKEELLVKELESKAIELRKSSPILFDFLNSNLGLEVQSMVSMNTATSFGLRKASHTD